MKSINQKRSYKMISDYVLELIKQDFVKLETEEDSALIKIKLKIRNENRQ